MTNTASNVIVGYATMYTAPANTAIPAVPSTAGATAWATPSSPWVATGFTEDGITLNVDRKIVEIRVEEQTTPVSIAPDEVDVTIDLSFAEDTIANMLVAYGGGTVTTVAASGSVPGQTVLNLADPLTALAVVFYGMNTFGTGFQRQVYIPEVISAGKVKTSYKRSKSPRMYPTTLTAYCAMSQISIIDITAPVT